jgi:hypothetical protein
LCGFVAEHRGRRKKLQKSSERKKRVSILFSPAHIKAAMKEREREREPA